MQNNQTDYGEDRPEDDQRKVSAEELNEAIIRYEREFNLMSDELNEPYDGIEGDG